MVPLVTSMCLPMYNVKLSQKYNSQSLILVQKQAIEKRLRIRFLQIC